MKADAPEIHVLRAWLDSWRGIGAIAVGMARQGYDLQLTRYAEQGWRANFYPAGIAHSVVVGSGWASPLSGSALLTAAHVLDNVEAAGAKPFVGWPPSELNQPLNLLHVAVGQRWPHVDMALLMVPGARFTMLPWDARSQPLLATVKSFGFPYGLDSYHRTFTLRALGGPIAGHRHLVELPGRPVGYELQVQAPRGLSGAALLTEDGRVAGCVLANSTSRMMVFGEAETVMDEKGSRTVERYEALHLGIAIRSDEILKLRLDDGSTVRDLLVKSGCEIADGPTEG